jgi:hypothetical protein
MKHTFLLRLAGLGFSTAILFLAITAAIAQVFGTPQALKTALQQSGAYDTASQQLASKAGEATASEAGEGLPLDKADVSQAAAENFSAKAIQTNAEEVIDGSYGWLEGKTDKPDITIDLSPYIAGFTQSVGDQAVQRVQGLPACTPEQLRQLDPNNIDVFNLPCMPPGVNLATAKEQAITQATKSNEFLQDPVITTDSLPKDAEGKTAIDNLAYVPQIFQWTMRAPWIFAAIAALSAVAIMLITKPEWQAGIRKLARTLFVTGLILTLFILLTRLLFNYLTRPDGTASKLAGGDFKDVILAFARSLEQAFNNNLLVFGIVYILAGVAGLTTLRFLKSRAGSVHGVAASTTSGIHNSSSTPPNDNYSSDTERRGDDSPSSSNDSSDSGSSSDGGSSSSD